MGKKTVSDEQIVAAIMNNGTFAVAADSLHLSVRTLCDKMKDKDFQAVYAAAKTDIVRQATFNINGKLSQAIDTIAEIMSNTEVNAAVRLQAAQTILNNADKFATHLTGNELSIKEYCTSIYDMDL